MPLHYLLRSLTSCVPSPLGLTLQQLQDQGLDRLRHTWRPSTWTRYNGAWNRFVKFCTTHDIAPAECTMVQLIAYNQALLLQQLSTATIRNTLSALKTMFRWHNINTKLWESDQWQWNIKSLALANRAPQHKQSVVTFQYFLQAVVVADQWGWPFVKVALILGFLGLLRISNLAPVDSKVIDNTRNSLLSDLVIQGSDLVVSVKWAKNIQTGAETLRLPRTDHPLLCPVRSWLAYTLDYLRNPADQSLPILLHRKGRLLTVVDQKALRFFLHRIWSFLGLEFEHFTPNRRGGATFYVEQGLPLEDIKRLGLWRSDAIQHYLRKLNFNKTKLYDFLKVL